ncbi:MAG: hypothetical protein ACOC5D_04985 [Thermoplasmatota archaeon]
MAEKKQEEKQREIIIKTDGNSVEVTKAEVSGKIELRGILLEILKNLN